MNLIEKLGLEKCKAIVGGAVDWASHYVPSTDNTICCHNENHFYFRDQEKLGVEHIRLSDIRTAIADHNRTDHCSDIRNHISPLTEVINYEQKPKQEVKHGFYDSNCW